MDVLLIPTIHTTMKSRWQILYYNKLEMLEQGNKYYCRNKYSIQGENSSFLEQYTLVS